MVEDESSVSRQDFYIGRGERGVRFICPCPCAVSLLSAVLLAHGEQQTDNGRRRTVVHWNVPLIIRLPRRVIADLVLASYSCASVPSSHQ